MPKKIKQANIAITPELRDLVRQVAAARARYWDALGTLEAKLNGGGEFPDSDEAEDDIGSLAFGLETPEYSTALITDAMCDAFIAKHAGTEG